MADVKWIKITTDIFDDEKILLIESLPDADAIIVIWFKLLCLAGKQNNSGVFMMGNSIPYTDKMLATIFRRKEATVQLALSTFQQFGMIEIIDGVITIPNWGKHQNLDQIESRKEYMRNYMNEYREKQKALTSGKVNSKVNSKSNVNEAEEEREREKELKKDKEDNREVNGAGKSAPGSLAQQVIDLYNSICISLPSAKKLTNNRKKAINARLSEYTLDDLKALFERAEASSFLKGLKGDSDRGWTANLDWLINEQNMTKVLEGRYDDKSTGTGTRDTYELDDFFKAAVEKERPKTAADDEGIRLRAENLKKQFGG